MNRFSSSQILGFINGQGVKRSVVLNIFLAIAISIAFGFIHGCGCDDDDGSPSYVIPSDQLTISGHVYLSPGGAQSQPELIPADGAQVTASTDLNNNGVIDFNESATVLADNEGSYRVAAPTMIGKKIVLSFYKEGYAKLLKTVEVNSLGEIILDGSLTKMDPLTKDDLDRWRDDAGTVEVSGIDISSGYARVFNPVTDTDRFPGSFSDRDGNMLISGVFTAFELNDAKGKRINRLKNGETAEIRMKVPKDTWDVIQDLTAGNGQIDVPMYYFDEASGEWIRDGQGWLENGDRAKIDEGQIAIINNKSFTGELFAVSNVSHFSYWNVDWPVDSHACIKGRIVDTSGNPVAGATVNVEGVTYSGSSSPQTTDINGEFCVDVMRSEGPGEDVDNDGTNEETQSVLISATSQGKMYRFTEIDVTTEQGSCPDGCMDIGNLSMNADNEVEISVCEISGQVTKNGSPADEAFIFALDETLNPDLLIDFCNPFDNCYYFTTSDSNGDFSVSGVYATKLNLMAWWLFTDETFYVYYTAQKNLFYCPSETLNLDLEFQYCWAMLSVSYNDVNKYISWSPIGDMQTIIVYDGSTYEIKWFINSENGGFPSPVTYPNVPGGATQLIPEIGTAASIESGDMISVYSTSGAEYDGHECVSFGDFIVE